MKFYHLFICIINKCCKFAIEYVKTHTTELVENTFEIVVIAEKSNEGSAGIRTTQTFLFNQK